MFDNDTLTEEYKQASKKRVRSDMKPATQFTTVERLAVIKDFEDSRNVSLVAQKYGISYTTIQNWVQAKEVLFEKANKGILGENRAPGTGKKVAPETIQKIYEWCISQMSKGNKITREGIRSYGREYCREAGMSFSRYWIDKFALKYHIPLSPN